MLITSEIMKADIDGAAPPLITWHRWRHHVGWTLYHPQCKLNINLITQNVALITFQYLISHELQWLYSEQIYICYGQVRHVVVYWQLPLCEKREKNGGKTVDPIFIFQSILEHQPRNRNQIFVSRARKVSDGADTPVKFYRISNLRETSKGEDFKLRGNEKRSWRHLAANSAARGGNFRIFVYDRISPTDFFADGKRWCLSQIIVIVVIVTIIITF